jgi:hypothetical protein
VNEMSMLADTTVLEDLNAFFTDGSKNCIVATNAVNGTLCDILNGNRILQLSNKRPDGTLLTSQSFLASAALLSSINKLESIEPGAGVLEINIG